MHRRLYRKRNEHAGMAFYQNENRFYEVIYDQDLLDEQDRLKKESILTAELKPHWIWGTGDHWQKRKRFCAKFEASGQYKPYFGMHHLPIIQPNLLSMVA